MIGSRRTGRYLVGVLLLAACAETDDGDGLRSHGDQGPSPDAAAPPAAEPEPVAPEPEADEEDAAATPEPAEPPEPDVTVPVTPPSNTPAVPSTATPVAPPPIPVVPAPSIDAGLEPEPEPEPVDVPEPDPLVDAMGDPVENPTVCPEAEPREGESCDQGSLVCKYGSALDCRNRLICSNGTWFLEYGPRDCPESCPDVEPSEGDPCDVDRAVCDFGEDPSCAAQWLCWEGLWARTFTGDCALDTICPESPPETGSACELSEVTERGGRCIYEGGSLCGCSCSWFDEEEAPTIAWNCTIVPATYPPSYLTACPLDVPEPGTPCDTGSTCGYPLNDMCMEPYAGATLANCVDGLWALSTELPQ